MPLLQEGETLLCCDRSEVRAGLVSITLERGATFEEAVAKAAALNEIMSPPGGVWFCLPWAPRGKQKVKEPAEGQGELPW